MAADGGKSRPDGRWTKTRETMFLDHLALTANVAAAERVAMMPPGSAYRWRRRSAEFRRAWEQALREGYGRLEMGMLARALETLGPEDAAVADGAATATVTADMARGRISERAAMTLLSAHRASVAKIAADEGSTGAKEKVAAMLAAIARHSGEA
jgi:hypothetical protein